MRYLKLTENNHKPVIIEGGVMPGVGPIHRDEIDPTLGALENSIGYDLRNNTLGSAGKKEYSNDIDVAPGITEKQVQSFIERLEASPKVIDVVYDDAIIMAKVKIVDYEGRYPEDQTGYVKVDFYPGEQEWLKVFYAAPRDEDSNFTGKDRNRLLSIVARYFDSTPSDEKKEDGRPVYVERLHLSKKHGLVKVIDRDGVLKKVSGPWKSAEEIANQLGLDAGSQIGTVEDIINTIHTNYPTDLADKIIDKFEKRDEV